MAKEPDKEEKVIRFGCGALLGLFVAFSIVIRLKLYVSFGYAAAVIIGVTAICGILAKRQGDAFWKDIFKWLPWI